MDKRGEMPSPDDVRRRLESIGLCPIELDQEPPWYILDHSEIEAFGRADGTWEIWVPSWWKTGQADGLVWCLRKGDTPVVEIIGLDDGPRLLVRDAEGVLCSRALTSTAAAIWREKQET